MSVTVTNKLALPYHLDDGRKKTVRDVAFDSSYAEGGEPLTASELGFPSAVEYATCTIQEIGGSVNVASAAYDEAEGLIHLFDETPAEVAKEANVEGVVVRVVAYGY